MEVWKAIKGYEGLYEVSNKGRVRSLDRIDCRGQKRKGKCILQKKTEKGYLYLQLSNSGVIKTFRTHRLVAQTFIQNPENKPQVNHINGIKADNRVENLEWTTPSENLKHAVNLGLKQAPKGTENGKSKLSEKQVIEIYKRVHKGEKLKKLAVEFGVSISTISNVKLCNYWGWLIR